MLSEDTVNFIIMALIISLFINKDKASTMYKVLEFVRLK